jgi:hypothetical protein
MTLHQMATEWHQATQRMKTTSAKLLAKLRHVRGKAKAAKVVPGPAGPTVHDDAATGNAWSK